MCGCSGRRRHGRRDAVFSHRLWALVLRSVSRWAHIEEWGLREVAVQTGAWALLFSACSIIGALNTDGWFSGVFWLAAIVLGGIAAYGAILLYRSRGMDLNR